MTYGNLYAARIDLLFESALLLSAICFSLSVYVLSRGVSNTLNLWYSALTLAVSVWSLAFFLANVLNWRFFESVHILSTLCLGPLSLLCLQALLRPEGYFYRWLVRLSILVSILLSAPVTFGLDRLPWIRDMSYYSPVLIVVACSYLLLSERLAARPRGRWGDLSLLMSKEVFQALKRRNLWIYSGGVVTTLLCVMDRVPWLGRTVPAIGNLLLALYFYFLKDAVLSLAMVNPRRTLGRILTNSVGAIIVFIIFVSITRWVQGNPILYLINMMLAAYIAVLSLDPVRRLANYFFQHLFFTEAGRVEGLILESNKELAGVFHGNAIAAATRKFLQRALQNDEMISFYAIDAEGKKLRKLFDATKDQSLPEALPSSFPLMNYWTGARAWKPALDKEIEAESERIAFSTRAGALQLSLDSLRSLNSTMALPLTYKKSVLGFVTIAATEPPELWEDSWAILSLLAPFFERAGEALHELDIYARLRDRDRLATVGEMAAGLAHEIRNPLGAIKGAAQVMEIRAGDPNEAFLSIIVQEVNRLNGVVSQFLNYAKPFQSEHEYADLNQIVVETVERFRRRQEGLEINLNLDLGPPLSPILCQAQLIAQVLTNLLDNAAKAIRNDAAAATKKSPAISVRLDHTIRDEEAQISLSVEDNGPGMNPEMLDKIFIPFFTSSPQGTGLGLSICQKIAEAHGGHMEAASIPGEGAVMTLRFSAKLKE